ncbi:MULTISPECIES: ParA family protein [Lysinibacillus]|uniref:ParA family protein n=1 Tax=Lysinibacillus antri TaxID=2498145 RepID=A0A3S0PM60_9BACI|nr:MULTISPECIES: ParA family protein [Lysinibacillus]RUL47437.1 ParA family protein [Lysinibacillus antri]TSI07909.1 ParA family protein [Lysinibacillus sp. BW-2-10]
MSYVLSVMSTKGGVGKSTLSKFLAITFEEMGKSVCVIDLCQNGSISTGFLSDRDSFKYTTYDWLTGACKPSEVVQRFEESGIYYIPSNETIDDFERFAEKKFTAAKRLHAIKEKVEPLKKLFDVIIFDTHPSENSDLVSYAIAASNYCLIPLETDLDSVLGTKRSVEIITEFMDMQELDYGIVPNKVSQTNFKLKRQLQHFIDELVEAGIPKEKFLSTIRYSDVISSSKNEKTMLTEYKMNKYAQKIMGDFKQVATEIDAVLAKVEV